MALYLSDQPGSIDDFSHLNVTVTSVGVHRTNATGNRSNDTGQWITRNLSGTFDLTQLRGENASMLTSLDLPNGTYNNVFVYVSAVNGTLTDGSQASVELPSSKLHIATQFDVGAGEQSHFVFDVMVHSAGGSGKNAKYLIRPNVKGSGKNKPVTAVGSGQGSGGGQHGGGSAGSGSGPSTTGSGNGTTSRAMNRSRTSGTTTTST